MTQAVAQILEEAELLSADERAEIADRMVESLGDDVAQRQIAEVRRRIAQVESGEVTLISGPEALAQVRELIGSDRKGS